MELGEGSSSWGESFLPLVLDDESVYLLSLSQLWIYVLPLNWIRLERVLG